MIVLASDRRSPERRLAYQRVEGVERRRMLVSSGLCLNGGHHGEATHGVRCEDCYWTHRRVA